MQLLIRRSRASLVMMVMALAVAVPSVANATTYTSSWAYSSSPITTGDFHYGIKGSAYGSWTLNSVGWVGKGRMVIDTDTAIDYEDVAVQGKMTTWSSAGSCTSGVSGGVEIGKTVGISGGKSGNCTFDWARFKTDVVTIGKATSPTTYYLDRGSNPAGNGVKASFVLCVRRPWYDTRADFCSVEPQSSAYTIP